MVFTDPPYNVSIKGILSANGKVKHPEFVMASGEMSSEEFTEFLTCSLNHHAAYCQQGAVHFVLFRASITTRDEPSNTQKRGSRTSICSASYVRIRHCIVLGRPAAPTLFSLIGVQGALELVGGFLILIGLFTRPVAFVLAGDMAVAYFMAHAPKSFFPR